MKWKKCGLFGFLALMLCLFFLFNAQAAYTAETVSAPTKIWVEPTETNDIPAQIDLFKVRVQTGGSTLFPTYSDVYQLYLPGNVDLANCFLSWDGGMQASVGGQSYESGSCPVAPLDTQTRYSFSGGGQSASSFTLITYQGSANVPCVFIDIDESGDNPSIAEMDGDPDHETTCTGRINIDGQWYAMPKMKGRGNVTWSQASDKRPYNITLDAKIQFPGIDSPATKKWSFLAEILDHSLLCNRSGFYLAHEMGIGQDTASADVWMNGEYQGCYTVTPKTDSFVTKNGFMIEEDNYKEKPVADGGDPQFALEGLNDAVGNWSSKYNRITVKKMGDNLLMNNGVLDESPENMEAAAAEIQAWLQEAWDAIRSDDGYNDKGKYYTDYIDIESFAKMYLMHEYVKSYDVCAGSILFHRDGQGENDKLFAGPLWDLDNAMGAVYQNSSLGRADDRRNGDRRSGEGDFIPNITEYKTSIYKTLSKHEDFMAEVYRQYNKNRSAFNSLPDDVDQMISEIGASARMNHIKVDDLSNNNHRYRSATTLGSGQYRQNYLATTDSKTDWANYAANLKTYISTRTLWFANNYYDPSYVDPATCEHEYEAVVTPASCTEAGFTTYSCPICGDSYTEPIAKIAHDYQDGVCSVCGEVLRTVSISCEEGASVTVYETQDVNGACTENASIAYPRDSETGLIDCSGDGQVNFVVNLAPGYELESVSAEPATAYKNLKLPTDTGITNGYRLTKVKGDLSISVKVCQYISFDPNGGTGTMTAQKLNRDTETVLNENLFSKTGYRFDGWNTAADGSGTAYADKASVTLSKSTTLYAQWKATSYTVTFLNEDGTVLQSSDVAYGETPSYTGETPSKAADAQYSYSFAAWSPAIVPVSADATYTATYNSTLNSYTVIFLNEDGSVLQRSDVAYGETPSYTGETPSKAADAQYSYSFAAWSPAIVPVSADATYTASFSTTARTYGGPVWSWTGDEENGYTAASATFTTNDGQAEFSQTVAAELEISSTAPDCETAGETTYTASVSFNGSTYSDEREVSGKALGHDYQTVTGSAVSPTCTNAGKEADQKCSRCDALITGNTIPALGHNMTAHAAADATCEAAGNSAYWSCGRCRQFFSDANGQNTIAENSWLIPALGHDWGKPEWDWSEDYLSATATFTCARVTTHTRTLNATVDNEIDAVSGGTKYTATVNFENKVYTDTKIKESGPVNPSGLKSITVTQSPTKTEYTAGESFDPKGMVVTATYQDGSTKDVTNAVTISPSGALTTADTLISISYSENGSAPARTIIQITVNAASGGGGGSAGGGGGGGAVAPAPKDYAITVESLVNGSLTLSKEQAAKGEVIVITPAPDAGYELEYVRAVDKNSAPLSLKDNGDGTYSFTMPDGPVKVTASFQAKAQDIPAKEFTDVDANAWYRECVDYVVAKGLMNGVSEDKFAPNGTLSRDMLVTVLYRLEGQPAVTAANPFDDVADDQWYGEAVVWANDNAIVNGYGNGKFGPTDKITREQFAAILYRYAKLKGYDLSAAQNADLSAFVDAADVSDWAKEAMQWACGAGLIQGNDQHKLQPGQGTSRAEAAAILMRFIESVK